MERGRPPVTEVPRKQVMKQIAIRSVGLSKRYQIAQARERYRTLRDTLSHGVAGSWRWLQKSWQTGARRSAQPETFWALKDVSFEIKQGDVVGIIGRNGAGKSTLLKVLSRITEPTEGYADISGRVGALLEVGTGFHPELSGRENILLNGSILGMRRSEILRQFDEIVTFAEVEKFIDMPVKHYSSGMYLRLAFSVAAHLRPEILLVDEVLAVGDAAFQRKCLGKMEEVANQGRTVIFVSHNMSAIQELCQRAILLDRGSVAFEGTPGAAVGEYFKRVDEEPVTLNNSGMQLSLGRIEVESPLEEGIAASEPFKVCLPLMANELRNPWVFFILEDFTGRMLLHRRIATREMDAEVLHGPNRLEVEVPALWLSPGVYSVYFKFLLPTTNVGSGRVFTEKFMLEVRGEVDSTGRALLNPQLKWQLHPQTQNAETELALTAIE